jgi:long-chain acyl-CoA synthetase
VNTIPGLLEERAGQCGDKTLVFYEKQEFSYSHLNEYSARMALNLARHGVGEGDKVVAILGNCMEALYLFLGLGRIGAVIVPVNPTLKPDEIAYIINDSEAETVVASHEFIPSLDELQEMAPRVKQVFVQGDAVAGTTSVSVLLEPVAEITPIVGTMHHDAALIYTSGTTGMPKGVILTHRNYAANAYSTGWSNKLDERTRCLCVLPLFHVNAQVVSVLMPIVVGGSVVLMGKFNPFGVLPMIEKYRPTMLSAVPTIYGMMLRMPKAAEHDLSSIDFLVTGAAPMPEDIYRAVQKTFKKPMIAGYGLTEATCACAVGDYHDEIRWNSVGPALRYTSLRVVDREGLDLPVGEVGEIWVAGPTVMKGYYKDPEATAEVLQNGWLKTGDLGKIDEDGYVYIVARVKDVIIRGGQNIYPAQVEHVVAKIPGVEECSVVGVEDSVWGQEVLAVIKPAAEHELTERSVVDFCRKRLAAYKCPKYVRFVDALPKTATGKVRKSELVERFSDIVKKHK